MQLSINKQKRGKTIHTTKSSTCQQKGYENNNAKYNKININRKRTTQTLIKRRKTTPTNVIIDECILKMPRIIDDHKHEDQYTPRTYTPRKKDEIRSRAKKRKPSIISSTTAHPSQIVEAPILENETNNSEKINICLSILYIFKFLLLFGTIFPFITARYLFSFLKIIVLARFKKLNVILIIYTLFFVISYWKFSFIYNNTGNNNIITKNSISSLKGNNILYKTSFSETRTEIYSKFDQVIYNQNNFYNTKININISIILANLLMSIAFIIKNNFNRKTKIFFYFFLVTAFIIITVLKSSNQPPDSFKELKAHPTKEFFTIESLKLIHKIINLNELKYFTNITLGKMKYKHHCLFFKFIILLSGDVNLNPGPQNNVQQQNLWDNFSKRGLHLIHLNINSLLPVPMN